MGEYSKQLDHYLAEFEKKMKVKLPIPEKLAQRKAVNDSIDLKLGVEFPKTTFQNFKTDFESKPFSEVSSQVDPLSEIDQFDLDRIDERLRALGVNPDDALPDDDDEYSVATSDLSTRIENAVQTQI